MINYLYLYNLIKVINKEDIIDNNLSNSKKIILIIINILLEYYQFIMIGLKIKILYINYQE